jgi:hypothetical protein
VLAAAALGIVPAVRAQTQVPESHTVKTGDTLWDIAKQYLGDPFLWPDIYRMNTAVVEDPHWIYPGEVLRLAPSEAATAVPPADTAAGAPGETRLGPAAEPDQMAQAPDTVAPEEPDTSEGLFPPSRGRSLAQTLTSAEAPQPHPLRRYDFFSSGYLTEGEQLPSGRVLYVVTPLQIASLSGQPATTLYTRVAVQAPAGGSYQVGDSLLIADVNKPIEGYGRVVEPRALARVIELSEGHPIVTLVAVYGEVRPGLAVLPAEKFSDPGAVRPVPVSDGIEAAIVGWPGRRELKGAGNVLFIDKGKADGVAPGDVFEVRRTPGVRRDGSVRVAEPMLTLQVVHVRDRSATARVLGVVSPNVRPGTQAFQIAKLPS